MMMHAVRVELKIIMEGLVVGSHNSNEIIVIRSHGDSNSWEKPSEQVCGVCGDEVGLTEEGEVFVACNDCAFPICRACYDYERREGSQVCPRCKTRFNRLKGCARVAGDDEEDDVDDLQYEFAFAFTQDSSLSDSGYGRAMWKTKLEKWKTRQQCLHKMKAEKGSKDMDYDSEEPDSPLMDESRLPLSRKLPISTSQLNPYRIIIIIRLVVLGFFFHYRILHPVNDAYALWLVSVICEIWFAISWILDQLPKWLPVNRETYLDRLSLRHEREGQPSELPSVDIFVSTVDSVKESPLVTANAVLSVLAMDYPVDKISCYVSDDGASMLTFEALAQTCEFARKWVPFCKKYNIEPRAPEAYFSEKMEYLRDKIIPEFIKERRSIKREYEEFKVGMNALVAKAQKVPEEGWKMQDGTTWPGNDVRDHPGMIQVILGQCREDLPCLVYVSREKRLHFHHHNTAGAMNALLRVSAVMTNAPYVLILNCDHYINNSKGLREAMCFMMEPSTGKRVCYVQFPQEYANAHSSVFSDMNMKGLDGIQGPMNMGSGCLLRRLALYGYEENSPSRRTWKCWPYQWFLFSPNENTTSEKTTMDPKLEYKFGQSEIFISSTKTTKDGGRASPISTSLLSEAIHVIGCGYEEKTEWGKEVGWIYDCTAQDILTGFKMHCRGWRSIYSVPPIPAFKGNKSINRLPYQRAFGLVEIFLSRHCPLWCGYGRRLKWLQRLAYINAALHPFTSIPLLVYCTLPVVCLLTHKFITPEVNNIGGMLLISVSMCVLATGLLEMRWSGVGLGEWWKSEQLWVGGGVSSQLFSVVQGVLKVVAGMEGDANGVVIDWSRFMLIPPTTLLTVNVIGVVAGISNALSDGYNSLGPVLMASWVIAHLYPFLKGEAGGFHHRTPTAIVVYSILLASLISILWLRTHAPLLQDCGLDCVY